MLESTASILLMCESTSDATSRSGQLSLAGWKVIEACDQIEALSAVQRQAVDLSLLHLPFDDMADMDLPNVLRRVSTSSYMPVVILVPDAAEERRCRLLDSGADDVIPDTISPGEMTARLRALLRIKNLHDQLSGSRAALQQALERERSLLVKLRRDNEYLHTLATTDPLTRIQNVRSFRSILQHEFQMAKRYDQPLSVLMLDLDHFKVVNDTHGHPSGDYVLKESAVILKQSVRESDVVARTGGEEFSVVLPRASAEQALQFAERIRGNICSREFVVYGEHIHITTSIGLATYPVDAEVVEPEMLAYFADQALLTAKESGRDCVVCVRDLDRSVRARLRRQFLDRPSPPAEAEGEQAEQELRLLYHPA